MNMRGLSMWRCLCVAAVVASFALLILPGTEAQAPNRRQEVGVIQQGQGPQLGADPEMTPTGSSRVAAYPRSNYVWPYETGPRYGSVPAHLQNRADVVLTRVGSFRLVDVARGAVRLPAALRANRGIGHGRQQYFIVQYDPSVTNWRADAEQAIEANGGKVIGGMRNAAILARLDASALRATETLPGVQFIEPYHPAFKLSPAIGRTPLRDRNKAVSEVYELEVRLFPGEDVGLATQEISAAGGNVKKTLGRTLIVEIHRNQLDRIASIDAVQLIDEAIVARPMAEETTLTMQQGDAAPRTFSGAAGTRGGPYQSSGILGGGVGGSGVCLVTTSTACTDHTDCGIGGSADGELCSTGPQVLMILDSGIQLDANDLSDTNTSPGSASLSHRKVRKYEATTQFGGLGDDTGCDAAAQGGFTHGHVVAATAAGWATNYLPASYGDADSDGVGDGVRAEEVTAPGNFWDLDGVAPAASIVAYDGQVQPPVGESCGDPLFDNIVPGLLYNGPASGATTSGSLGVSYYKDGARIFNFSWGASSNTYSSNAIQVDEFLVDNPDAMVFISAGNNSVDADNDGIPDIGTLGTPATTKNGLAIGACDNGTAGAGPTTSTARAAFSSVGPAAGSNGCACASPIDALPCPANCRVAPQLMAPGNEFGGGNLGIPSEFACRSNDNDQTGMVECDLVQAIEGTSFSAPAAAGAALLVRDYFAQGYYPTGDSATGTEIPNISGALVKAILVSSAQYMRGNATFQVQTPFRGNSIQGWGRIQLDRALPLAAVNPTVLGLAVEDGAGNDAAAKSLGLGGAVDTTSAVGSGCSASAHCNVGTFELCDKTEPLQVALTWIDAVDGGGNGDLVNNLNLELESPTGRLYIGNFFTEDENRDSILDTTGGTFSTGLEDCTDAGNILNSTVGTLDQSAYSLRVDTCTQGDGITPGALSGGAGVPRDNANPIEMIALSPDLDRDGGYEPGDIDTDGDDDNQLAGEEGTWTIRVYNGSGSIGPSTQTYAVAVAGGVCLGSTAALDRSLYVCNEEVSGQIFEVGTPPSEATVEAQTTFTVLDSSGATVDTETGQINFTKDPSLAIYSSDPVQLSPGTDRDPGNGVLDVQDGDRIVMTYNDLSPVAPRSASAIVSCEPDISVGAITFGVFGRDQGFLVNGGCERNARGRFEFGFPDRYMDAGERIIFNFAFGSDETTTLNNLVAELRCVQTDANSPPDCLPGTAGGCSDPERSDNPLCNDAWMSITNNPIVIGQLPPNSAISANFNIEMGAEGSIPTGQKVELVLELTGATSGKTGTAVAISPQTLNVDEISTYYHTDFPTGGLELFDMDNNETIQGCIGTSGSDCDSSGLDTTEPITFLGDFLLDYQAEKRVYGDLTAGGTRNTTAALQMPWHFDTDKRGFTSGITAATDAASIADTIAQWGEDRNFNDLYDGSCSIGEGSDYKNGVLQGTLACGSDADLTGGNAKYQPCTYFAAGFCSGNPSVVCTERDDDSSGVSDDCEAGSDGVCDYLECSGIDGVQHDVCTLSSIPSDNCGGTCDSPTGTNLFCFSKGEDRDPQDFDLSRGWSTLGGCGWVTQSPGTCNADSNVGCYTDGDCVNVDSPGICSGGTQGLDCFTQAQCDTGTCSGNTMACVTTADCPSTETCDTGTPDGGTCTGAASGCDTGGAPWGQSAGGAWHTGRIGARNASATCMIGGVDLGDANCQLTETVSGQSGLLTWHEVLVSPELERVTPADDMEVTWWAWNQAVDLPDTNVAWGWEIDTNTEQLEPADLFTDLGGLNAGFGSYGPVSLENNAALTNGWSLFAPLSADRNTSTTGTSGTPVADGGSPLAVAQASSTGLSIFARGDRSGQNSCFFENGAVPASELVDLDEDNEPDSMGYPKPLDDDLNNGYCIGDFNRNCTAFCVGGTDAGSRCNDVSGDTDCAGGDCSVTSSFTASCSFDFGTCSLDLIGECDGTRTISGQPPPCGSAPNDPDTICPVCILALNNPPGCDPGPPNVDCDDNPDCPDPGGGSAAEVCIADDVQDTCTSGDTLNTPSGVCSGAAPPYLIAELCNTTADCPSTQTCLPGHCSATQSTLCDDTADCPSTETCVPNGLQDTVAGTGQPLGPCTDDLDCTLNRCVGGFCEIGGSACTTTLDCSACVFPNTDTDEYVTAQGPERNMSIQAFNGPDMRFTTLEDVYGVEPGEKWRASVGMINFEKNSASDPDPKQGYGIGVDDMMLEWREFSLGPDQSQCDVDTSGVGGSCATVDWDTSNYFEGTGLINISIWETTPSPNDCDHQDADSDGTDNNDTNDGTDCDTNGVRDVVVEVTSDNEANPGEFFVVNCVPRGTCSTTTARKCGSSNDCPSTEVCNLVAPTASTCPSGLYQSSVPVSSKYNTDGTVFIQSQGTANPFVEVLYEDLDDGTGGPCLNTINPDTISEVTNQQTVVLAAANVVVQGVILTDNGDSDGFADTNETMGMRIIASNKSGVPLSGVVARLASNDPKVDCIINPTLDLGLMPADDPLTPAIDEGRVITSEGFSFRIGNVQRTGDCRNLAGVSLGSCTVQADCDGGPGGTCDSDLIPFGVDLVIIIDGDDFGSTSVPQTVSLDLDLDAVGGSGPGFFSEGFNTGGSLGQFFAVNEDAALGNATAVDNHHCPFTDPDDPNSFGYGTENCWLTQDCLDCDTRIYWQQSIDRAFEGTGMAYYGKDLGTDLGFSTPLNTLESLQTTLPVNIGWDTVCEITRSIGCTTDNDCPDANSDAVPDEPCVPVAPMLTWKHQVSFVDGTSINASGLNRGTGRGVMMAQLADPGGAGKGDWIKLVPFVNGYDGQDEDNYGGCSFDPDDDGNTEDTFKAGTDVLLQDDFRDAVDRKFGPSSTCAGFPGPANANVFQFMRLGDTDADFNQSNIGRADGPGLQPTTGFGKGTWVESKVDLSRFRGRRLFLRFTATDEVADSATNETWEDQFGFNPDPRDDGWFVDDVIITDTLETPATVNVDVKPNTALASCPAGSCVAAAWTAGLTAENPVTQTVINGTCEDGFTPCTDASDCGSGEYCEVTTPAPGQALLLRGSQFSVCSGGFCTGNGTAVACTTDLDCGLCAGGLTQFRFWLDEAPFGTSLGAEDTLLRDWSDNATYLDAPTVATVYQVDVRCSSDHSCIDSTAQSPGLRVAPICPIGPNSPINVLRLDISTGAVIGAAPNHTANFTTASYNGAYNYAEGDLDVLRTGSYAGTNGAGVGAAVGGHLIGASTEDRWVLLRGASPNCNGPSWEGLPTSSFVTDRDNNLP